MATTKQTKTFGIILGVITIILGIYIIATPPDSYSTDSVRSYTFGADYYTEQYEATRSVVRNTSVTASNVRELGHAISFYFGCFFIIFGLLIILKYSSVNVASPAIPIETTSTEPNKNESQDETSDNE